MRENPGVITDAVHVAVDCATRTRDDSIRSRSIDADRGFYRCLALTLPISTRKKPCVNRE
jgi:hypothetical protein